MSISHENVVAFSIQNIDMKGHKYLSHLSNRVKIEGDLGFSKKLV